MGLDTGCPASPGAATAGLVAGRSLGSRSGPDRRRLTHDRLGPTCGFVLWSWAAPPEAKAERAHPRGLDAPRRPRAPDAVARPPHQHRGPARLAIPALPGLRSGRSPKA